MAKKTKTQTNSPATSVQQAPDLTDLIALMGTNGLPDLHLIYPLPAEALASYTIGDTKKRGLPDRCFQFMCGINLRPTIFNILATKGFSRKELKAGWILLYAANGTLVIFLPQNYSPGQRFAVAELDGWDEPNFEIISAGMRYHYPSQHKYLFYNLEPQVGPAAVAGVKTLLTRVDILRLGRDKTRKDSVEEDKEAIDYLETQGLLTKEERDRLWQLIHTVETPPDDLEVYATYEELQKHQEDALVRLGIWFDKWSSIARKLITKRSHLITLGLAQRRKPKTKEEDATDETQPQAETESAVQPSETDSPQTNGQTETV